MGVLETGKQKPTSEVDDLRAGTYEHVEVGFGYHRGHPASGDRGPVARPVPVTVEDVAVAKDQ